MFDFSGVLAYFTRYTTLKFHHKNMVRFCNRFALAALVFVVSHSIGTLDAAKINEMKQRRNEIKNKLAFYWS